MKRYQSYPEAARKQGSRSCIQKGRWRVLSPFSAMMPAARKGVERRNCWQAWHSLSPVGTTGVPVRNWLRHGAAGVVQPDEIRTCLSHCRPGAGRVYKRSGNNSDDRFGQPRPRVTCQDRTTTTTVNKPACLSTMLQLTPELLGIEVTPSAQFKHTV